MSFKTHLHSAGLYNAKNHDLCQKSESYGIFYSWLRTRPFGCTGQAFADRDPRDAIKTTQSKETEGSGSHFGSILDTKSIQMENW